MRVFRLLRILAVVWRYRLDEIAVASLRSPALVRIVAWTTGRGPRESRAVRLRRAVRPGQYAGRAAPPILVPVSVVDEVRERTDILALVGASTARVPSGVHSRRHRPCGRSKDRSSRSGEGS